MIINNDFELGKEAHDAEYEKIERDSFKNTSPVERPHALIVGGQTGAGKSTLASGIKETFPDGNYVRVSTDELRDYHPQIDEINEGTLQNTQGITDRLQDLKDNGYQVTIQVIATHERDSTLGIYERYESGIITHGHGRYVPQEFHDRSYDALPDTVREIEQQQLADRIQIFDRSGECIHDNQLEHDKWTKPGSAEVLEKGREHELTPEQIKEYSRDWQEKVFQPMEDRQAPQDQDLKRDLDQELNNLQDLSSVRDLPSEVGDYLKSVLEPDRFDILKDPIPEDRPDIERGMTWVEAVTPGALEQIGQYLQDKADHDQTQAAEQKPEQSHDLDLANELYTAQDQPQEPSIDIESKQALEILTQLQELSQIDRSVEIDRGTADSGTRSAGIERAGIEHTGMETTPSSIQHTGMEHGYGFDTTDSFDRGGDGDTDRGDGDMDRGSER